ncbi:unnamed protein product [Mytilus edulis]|uniref:Fibrinogen C-terminal domain-containing protein n=1 Tax=Mytilus edulis TaxID=6550 RepID=A0A8S3TKI0_MYTED|nr:unnamed protein product [Mytilus edulis]
MIGRPIIVCNEKGKWNKMFSCTDNKFVPRDYSDFPQGRMSGVYTFYPENTKFDVYCDMETAGFGWTVLQRIINGTIDFYRGWSDYKDGFGNLESEFWLGNSLFSTGNRNHNDMMFSTIDRDNDKSPGNCATTFKGAWWYNSCHLAYLNGEYLGGYYSTKPKGIVWAK